MKNKNNSDRIKKLRLIRAKLKRLKRNAEFSVVIQKESIRVRNRDVK